MAKILSCDNCKIIQEQLNFPKRLFNRLLRLKSINNITVGSMKREISEHYYLKNVFHLFLKKKQNKTLIASKHCRIAMTEDSKSRRYFILLFYHAI